MVNSLPGIKHSRPMANIIAVSAVAIIGFSIRLEIRIATKVMGNARSNPHF